MTNGLLISIGERYGNADSVAKTGPDLAIEQATRNVAAAMFALIDDPQVSLDCTWEILTTDPHKMLVFLTNGFGDEQFIRWIKDDPLKLPDEVNMVPRAKQVLTSGIAGSDQSIPSEYPMILWMEETMHQLMSGLSHYL